MDGQGRPGQARRAGYVRAVLTKCRQVAGLVVRNWKEAALRGREGKGREVLLLGQVCRCCGGVVGRYLEGSCDGLLQCAAQW